MRLRVGLDCQKRRVLYYHSEITVTEVVCVRNFPDMRSVGDIVLNSLHRKSKREKSQNVYGIILILVESCSFQCTLSLY